LEDNFQFKGNPDVIQEYGASVAYLSRTNASVIERMYTLMTLGMKFHSVRNIDELFALPLVIDTLMQYRVLTDPRYKFLEKEFYKFLSSNCYGDFTDYLQLNMGSPAIVSACNTVNKFKKLKIDIKYLKERIKACNTDKRLIVTTAHAYKGLEADTVIIENDLNNSVNNAILSYNDAKANFAIDLPREVKEDLNTYYVALSRAKTVLNNVHYI
jgi:ATP-dependent exoDNAse (exonuclease V) beta subunit